MKEKISGSLRETRTWGQRLLQPFSLFKQLKGQCLTHLGQKGPERSCGLTFHVTQAKEKHPSDATSTPETCSEARET